jgi:hypothetical protein
MTPTPVGKPSEKSSPEGCSCMPYISGWITVSIDRCMPRQKYFEVKVISLTRLYLAFASIRYTWAGFEASQSGAPDKTPLPIKYDGAKHNYKDKQCT